MAVTYASHQTLAGGVVTAVTFTRSANTIRVRNRHATLDLYFRVDGIDPTVAGDDSYYCGPGENVILESGSKNVRLISSGAATFSVELY